jgi:hypothetical protein
MAKTEAQKSVVTEILVLVLTIVCILLVMADVSGNIYDTLNRERRPPENIVKETVIENPSINYEDVKNLL